MVAGAAGVAMISLAKYAGTTGFAARSAAASLPATRATTMAAARTFLFTNMCLLRPSVGMKFGSAHLSTTHRMHITCRRRHRSRVHERWRARHAPFRRVPGTPPAHASITRSPQTLADYKGLVKRSSILRSADPEALIVSYVPNLPVRLPRPWTGAGGVAAGKLGRASCRERVCQ